MQACAFISCSSLSDLMMHLLQRSSDGTLSLTEFQGTTPRYAILSHRWEKDEPTFQDITNGTGKDKAGYAKLHFCGRQAAKDGLDYFWCDTVCIDKSSSSELSEAINSMFRWYKESTKCYVYMSDVITLKPDFAASKWFTRGWTLQELIAPQVVEFYNFKGDQLGHKEGLVSQLSSITGIPAAALCGDALSDFSVQERMSWVEKRVTTRIEDKAYCLMGIFDVFMPILYGEGQRAFFRLEQEVNKVATQAVTETIATPKSTTTKIYNDGYNCFNTVQIKQSSMYYLGRRYKLVTCAICRFEYRMGSNDIDNLPLLDGAEGRKVPDQLLLNRFHYTSSDFSYVNVCSFRCFICKDNVPRTWIALKYHLEEWHTYQQVCDPDLRRSGKSSGAVFPPLK